MTEILLKLYSHDIDREEVWSNKTQYADEIPLVQLRITSYLGGNYVC
jgi:hypothetical protein